MSARAPRITCQFSDLSEQTELWLARLREMHGRSEPRVRDVVLWCDHPSSRGTDARGIMWVCDLCGAVFLAEPVAPAPSRVERFDQESRFGPGVLRESGEGLEGLRAAVQHQADVLRARATATGARITYTAVVVEVHLYADLETP